MKSIFIHECLICNHSKSAKKMFKNKKRCAHSICKDCIVKHIIIKVEDAVAEIKCPNWPACKQLLNPHTCRKIIPKLLFEKWCDLLCESALQPYERSYCPNKKCSELIINECGGTVKKSKCPKCKGLYCFRCNVPWPRCNNCQELENDKKFFKLAVSKKWVKCPSCSYYVERINGCRHMICRFDISLSLRDILIHEHLFYMNSALFLELCFYFLPFMIMISSISCCHHINKYF